MSDDWGSPYGLSFRRNSSCLSTDSDCGQTWAPFYACCPNGTHYPTQNNVKCCPSDADCSDLFKESPHCANSTGNLLKANGYFCCPAGTVGVSRKDTGFVGCAKSVDDVGDAYNLLATISTGPPSPTLIFSFSSSTSSFATSTSSPSPSPSRTDSLTETSVPTATSTANPSGSSAQINTGAVAGGVVGGVAGFARITFLIWFYLRRRKASLRKGARVSSYSYYSGAPKGAAVARNSVLHEPDNSAGSPPQPPIYELATANTPTAWEMRVSRQP
ncbi:hypothetical protein BDV23DRAFT_177501 [Aspergillus alliaceus]|uniref:Uncharacterized protein n=1 Tax=Petromyces alliaceus TaxID=209559 RepID=A0A5N7CQV5_PETAA|nr:hypothetical protein BDV23DRAFT_177501 [Aspergillus alliaceus]